MFERILRAWDIMKDGGAVLLRHPKLLLLPAISLLTVLGVAAVAVTLGGDSFANLSSSKAPLAWAALLAVYFSLYFVIILFNAALLFCVLEAFANRDPSLRDGLMTAFSRLPQIFMWTAVAATVGLFLSALESLLRSILGRFGSWVGEVTQFAWTVTTYFVLPLLVTEGSGPITATKRSGMIIKSTWGEAVVGEFGLGLFTTIALIPAMAVVALSLTISQSTGVDWPAMVGIVGVAVPYSALVLIVVTSVSIVFQAGVYVYASKGTPPGKMDAMLLSGAFRRKD